MGPRCSSIVLLALLDCCSSLHPPLAVAVLRATLPAASPAVRAGVACMKKKGRAQGGGPKIALGRKKKTESQINAAKKRTEIERAKATQKKKPVVMRGRQEDRYADQAVADAPGWPVYVRTAASTADGCDAADAAGDWLEIGHVSVSKGAANPLGHREAALVQKRLILETAMRNHPLLQRSGTELEMGISEPRPDADADADADVDLLQRGDAHPLSMTVSSLELAAACGFMGIADPTAGHYYGSSETDSIVSDERKVKLGKIGLDAKSATAIEFSKSLGLRSG